MFQKALPVDDVHLSRRRARWLGAGVLAVIGCIVAMGFAGQWDAYLRFSNTQPHGTVDPAFGHDLAFYMLRLPFLEIIQNTLLGFTLLGVVLVLGAYALAGELGFERRTLRMRAAVARHLTVNVVLFLVAGAITSTGTNCCIPRTRLFSGPATRMSRCSSRRSGP